MQAIVTHSCDNCGRAVTDRDEMLCSVCKVKASRAHVMRHAPESPSARLNAARRARDLHGEQCAAWDYESDGNCDECADLRHKVELALAAYNRAFGRPAKTANTFDRWNLED
jgi:hypothetical protein